VTIDRGTDDDHRAHRDGENEVKLDGRAGLEDDRVAPGGREAGGLDAHVVDARRRHTDDQERPVRRCRRPPFEAGGDVAGRHRRIGHRGPRLVADGARDVGRQTLRGRRGGGQNRE
jgi:hypothetical protein